MPTRNSSPPLRRSRENGGTGVASVEHRISELEQLASSQNGERRIQFERIGQMQADWDMLRPRLIKSSRPSQRAYSNYTLKDAGQSS